MEMTSQTEPLLNDSNESSSESDINTGKTLCKLAASYTGYINNSVKMYNIILL